MRFFFVFILILAAVHVPVYLLAKSIFNRAGNPQRKVQYALGATVISFTVWMFLLVYLFLIKPDLDRRNSLEISACKGYRGKISMNNLAGKWEVPWGFFTIEANGKVTEKYLSDGMQYTGSINLENNILTYLREDVNREVRNVYRICDYASGKLQLRLISTNKETIAGGNNMEWLKVQQ
jgi:hypothetical protein